MQWLVSQAHYKGKSDDTQSGKSAVDDDRRVRLAYQGPGSLLMFKGELNKAEFYIDCALEEARRRESHTKRRKPIANCWISCEPERQRRQVTDRPRRTRRVA